MRADGYESSEDSWRKRLNLLAVAGGSGVRAGEDFGVGTKLRVLTYEAQNDAFKSKTTRLNPKRRV